VPVGTETILVVEDEEAVRKVTIRALEAQGSQAIQARDAEEALELLDHARDISVDLVLSDLVLPGMGGA
jgi:two-component system cell cycle sensor histidine kinase/response regulator CckA